MTAPTAHHLGRVHFCYADPAGFSGQRAAVELVINGLSGRGWSIVRLPLPVLDRTRGILAALPTYLFRLVLSWLRILQLLGGRGGWFCIGMGQRRASFIRDFPPIFLASAILGRERTIVTLNGSLFMRWNLDSLDARLFRFMLKSAGRITVVGEDQRSHLVTMGIDGQRTFVVVNTCELEPLSATEVKSKHAEEIPPTRPIRLLHLGSLVDTKGFPEYLEALVEICATPGPAIDAVLCGPLAQIEYSERFAHIAEAERWIGVQMAAINGSTRVRIRWIRSAAGAEKSALFRQADIFVLPTRYSVEAQPLVLLEAMATGCAIITTRIGEIATILDDRSAQILPECTASALASALDALIRNPRGRAQLAAAAHERFASRYDIEHHLDAWERLLGARESVPNKHR